MTASCCMSGTELKRHAILAPFRLSHRI